MTRIAEVAIGEFFAPANGKPKYIKDYMDAHAGEHPVYSASLKKPFGYIDSFDDDGIYLTWVMNGYGGRVQEITGKFSANRDRGVFVPRANIEIPDLTYLRFIMEPQLSAAAVGRRVDGRLNEYTKIYPDTAADVLIPIPQITGGGHDYGRMRELGDKFRRIERARRDVISARDALKVASQLLEIAHPITTAQLGNADLFRLSIGDRVLLNAHYDGGIPAYSANTLLPFARVAASNLTNFDQPSLLWGIDGNFDWNYIEAGIPFATTDHCGRLQVIDANIDPYYLYWYLKLTRLRHGFDRVFRSSLTNMRAEIEVILPLDSASGQISLVRQKAIAEKIRQREQSRTDVLAALDDILQVKVGIEL